MNDVKLSILVPAIPGRFERLRAILTRVSLSAHLYNKKYPDDLITKNSLEFVIVDGGSVDETKDMCLAVGRAHRMKYVYLPIEGFVCASYPRNVGLRLCQGEVIGHLDVDHFPSENIVEGMRRPFVEGKIDKHINRGYVIDSSKSPSGAGPNVQWLESLNDHVLDRSRLTIAIGSLYKEAGIPPPGVNNTLWIWAAKREHIAGLGGYEELFCRQGAYSREEDDWRQRMLANGMPLWDGANQQFCAVHLWHPAVHRNQNANELNKELYKKLHGDGVMDVGYAKSVSEVVGNSGWEWGKLLTGSFSVIDDSYFEVAEHEEWVRQNVPDMPSYEGCWLGMKGFYDALEARASA